MTLSAIFTKTCPRASSEISPLLVCVTLLVVGVIPLPLTSAIKGKVINATTGKPVPSAMVTLIKFGGSQGMAPVGEMYTEPDGSFLFGDEMLDSEQQRIHAMLRAEYEGISYSKMVAPDSLLDNFEIKVYDIAVGKTLKPQMTALLFEPGDSRLVINQFFQFSNNSTPPQTFSDPINGTLRFNLPLASQGKVEVRTTGPSGMPLRSSARKGSTENIYYIDYALKPGDSLVELTYSLPYESGEPYSNKLLYKDLETRFVIPEGVTLEADDLNLMGQEPKTQASIYQYLGESTFSLRLRGQGQLSENSPGGSNSGANEEVIISPAPVAEELTWIFSLTGIILVMGFYNLLVSKQPIQEDISVSPDLASTPDPATKKSSSNLNKRRQRPWKAHQGND